MKPSIPAPTCAAGARRWSADRATSHTLLTVAIACACALAVSLFLNAGILVSLVLAAIFVALLLFRRAHRSRSLVVEDDGFSFSNHRGRHDWKWEDLNEVYEIAHPRHHFTLFHRSGERLRIGGLEGMADVGSRIAEESTRRFVEPAVSTYLRGGSVRFGRRLRISSSGIFDREEALAWDEVERIEVDPKSKHVTVIDTRKHQQWRRFRSAAMANLRLFDLLIDRLGSLNAKVASPEKCDATKTFPEKIFG